MKEEIRKKQNIKRKYFQFYRREMANYAILDNFLNAFSEYDSFLIYNSIPDEAETNLIISALTEAGKRVYFPRVEGDSLVAVPYGETKKNSFGIEEPIGEPYTGEIDITVIPVLAVNERGFRIGYGKGYYDRYLKDRPTKKVGLGYYFQIEEFTEDEWDEPLDLFICEKGIYYYGA